jgi:hypothetical protein
VWSDAPRQRFSFRELVMPGRVPGIHVLNLAAVSKTWMAGTSPVMTKK